MGLRERLADWISGGELSNLKRQRNMWERLYRNQKEDFDKLRDTKDDAYRMFWYRDDALRAIIERGNTASPNSTVKAMVQLAKEGLGEADGV